MNLILHQFKTDVRAFLWWLLLSWIYFAVAAALICGDALPTAERDVFQLVIILAEIFNAVFVVAALVQLDSLVGSDAGWLTRPIRRRHLFWAKSAFVVFLLLLPRVAAQSIAWMARGYGFHLLLCAAGQSLLFSTALVVMVAVLASWTPNLARFFLVLGIAMAGLFGWSATLEGLRRAGVLHQAGAIWNERPSFNASVLTVEFLALVAGGLVAWVAQARFKFFRVSIVCLALGVMAVPLLDLVWPFNFLKPRLTPAAPLVVSLSTNNAHINFPSDQKLARELSVSGVPNSDVAVIQDGYGTIQFDGQGPLQSHTMATDLNTGSGRLLPAASNQRDSYFRMVESNFPPQTLWFNDNYLQGMANAFSSLYDNKVMKQFEGHPPPGSLNGQVELDLFRVKKVAEAPLRPGHFNTLPGRWMTIREVKLLEGVIAVNITEGGAFLLWDRNLRSAAFNAADSYPWQSLCAYVLYDGASGEAFLARTEISRSEFPVHLNGETDLSLIIRFPYPALRERLLGMTAEEWIRGVRLCVFAPEYDGTGHYAFHQDHYQRPKGD